MRIILSRAETAPAAVPQNTTRNPPRNTSGKTGAAISISNVIPTFYLSFPANEAKRSEGREARRQIQTQHSTTWLPFPSLSLGRE